MNADPVMDRYTMLSGEGGSNLRERASRFIGIAFPVPDEARFKERFAGIEKEHRAARHLCYAWVLGEQGATTRSSDAGEPSGTAGRPILRRIQRSGLTFSAVVVVRYFGGTLLGKAGLVNAYGEAARLALEQAPRKQCILFASVVVRCTYAQVDQVRNDVVVNEGEVRDAAYGDPCTLSIALPSDSASSIVERWSRIGVEVVVDAQPR